jgi:transcriptional antiterminator NusG
MVKNWYAVHTYSGFEEKVKASIVDNARRKGLQDKISRVLIPTERVLELRSGKKRETDKKFFPGYILVEMELNDETWHLIKSIPRVTGFIGGTKPVALPEEEVQMLLQQIEQAPQQPPKTQYQKGENVRIIDGPFTNFVGVVDEIDIDHGRLKVMVSIFGRQTPVELNFYQVEKT